MRNRTPNSQRWYDELQSENTQALLDRLETEMDKEEIEDTDLIEAITKILNERGPASVPQESPEESLRQFRSQYAPILNSDFEDEKKPRSMGRRVARVALVACLCVVMLFAVAQACGVNLIEQFLEWREETFVLHGANYGGQMALDNAPEGEFTSLAEAVANYGITGSVVPTWIPEGFVVQYVRAKEQAHVVNITARYTVDDHEIIQKVFCYQGDGEYEVYSEHSNPTGKEYKANDITFLLTSNEGQCQASWMVDNCMCSINGDLTEREVKKMIDSIYPEER